VAGAIQAVEGVRNVHDLHLWTVKPGISLLTCHVTAGEAQLSQTLLTAIRAQVVKQCGISHMTIQLETSCCHPDESLCDLGQLASAHPKE
jgi:cobalt-zinc-cadmium efflux system protein